MLKLGVLLSILLGAGSTTIEVGPGLAAIINNGLNALTVFLIVIYGQRAKAAAQSADKITEALPYVTAGRYHKVEEIMNGEDR